MKFTENRGIFTVVVLMSMSLGACNWVDSTGRQNNEKPTIILDDGTPDDGFSLTLNEEASTSIDPSASADADGTIVSWSWDRSATAAGALDVCNTVDGFNSQFAASSLRDACTDQGNCELQVLTEEIEKTAEEIALDEAAALETGSTAAISATKTRFIVTAPKLKAPVGLTYKVTAKDNDGGTGFAEVSLCLIAINEAPAAVDDIFTIVEGTEKLITRASPVHLLSNDTDDIDVTNKPLSVIPAPIEFPRLSESFSLANDGGFSYFYQGDPSRPAGEEMSDSFEYEITDGIHKEKATVTLNIVTVDDPPLLKSSIPDQKLFAGIKSSYDFRKHFDDPEGAALAYSETTGQLPPSFSRAELADGKLVSTPKNEEVGDYAITLAASDGNATTSDDVKISILGNKPPTWANITDQIGTIGKFYSLDLARFANDPEGQPLSFRISGNPGFLNIKGSKVEGTPNRTGEWTIKASVFDGFNGVVSKNFKFGVFNSPPVVKNIPNQTAFTNREFALNASNFFSDPEGQSLTYSLSGASFLSINRNNGQIRGTSANAGQFTVTVTASDGISAVSDSFRLDVSNPGPTLVSEIPNQTIEVGKSVLIDIARYFTDPNDTLSFTQSGLPTGLSLSKNGKISGSVSQSTTSNYTVTITATEENGSQSISDRFTLTVIFNNPAPFVVSPIADQSINAGEPFSLNVSGNFDDDGALTFSATGLPPGLTISNSGVISGTAPDSAAGDYTVKVTAKESNGVQSADDSFRLTVNIVIQNNPPVLSPIPDQTGTIGVLFSFDAADFASDQDGDNLEYEFQRAPGFLDQIGSKLEGTPNREIVERTITVTVSDDDTSVSRDFNFSVPALIDNTDPDDDDDG